MLPAPGIRAKLAAVFFGVALFPLALVALVVHRSDRREIEETVGQKLAVIARMLEGQIDHQVDMVTDDAASLSLYPRVASLAADLVDGRHIEESRVMLREVLTASLRRARGVDVYLVLHPDTGEVLCASDWHQEGKLLDGEPWFSRAEASPAIYGPHYSETLGRNIAAATATLRQGGRRVGVLVSWIGMDGLVELFDRSVPDIGGSAYMVNRDGISIGADGAGAARPAVLSEGMRRALAGEEAGGVYEGPGGTPVVGAYRFIDSLDMALLVEIPRSVVLEDADRLLRRTVAGFASLAVLLGLAVNYLGGRLSRPLVEMSRRAGDIAAGRLDEPLPEDRGDEVGLLAGAMNRMARDLSRRETELRQSEGRYRALFEQAGDAIYLAEHDEPAGRWRFAAVNDVACRRLGYSREELLGMGPEEILFAEPGQDPPWETAAREPGGDVTFETAERTRDGARVDVEQSARLFEEGGRRYLQTISRDVTGRKRAERELKESEGRFRAIMEQAGDALFLHRPDGRLVDVNHLACESLGYTRRELLSMPLARVAELFPGGDAAAFVSRLREEGRAVTVEGLHRRADGSFMPVELRAGWIEVGGSPLVLVLARDLTERRAAEEERRRFKERMERTEKLESLGVLAGGIAHDFNNILTAILGNISLARMTVASNEEVAEILGEAEQASFRAKELTRQLLTFAKGGEPVKKTFSLAGLLRETAVFALRGTNAKCRFDLPGSELAVDADEGQIGQVVSNLVINAKQSMPEGGVVRIAAERREVKARDDLPIEEGPYVKVSVGDEGMGIPPDSLPRIFEPYFTTKQSGSGLGLATVYSVVRRHGGHVAVSSVLGRGTVVTFYLPAAAGGVEGARVSGGEPGNGKGRSCSVLVMDDEAAVRKVAGRMLAKAGHRVETAADGREALALYRKSLEGGRPFDVVLLDLTVPGGMGGREAARELAALDPGVRAVASSGYSNDPVMSQCRRYGFAAAIAKPYKVRELLSALEDVLALPVTAAKEEGKG